MTTQLIMTALILGVTGGITLNTLRELRAEQRANARLIAALNMAVEKIPADWRLHNQVGLLPASELEPGDSAWFTKTQVNGGRGESWQEVFAVQPRTFQRDKPTIELQIGDLGSEDISTCGANLRPTAQVFVLFPAKSGDTRRQAAVDRYVSRQPAGLSS